MAAFTELPGIGPKSAERIVHWLLAGDRQQARTLLASLQMAIEQIRPCRECFHLTESETCSICLDPRRDQTILCVVEFPRDITILERTGSFSGRYHVLNGRLAPLSHVGPDDLTLAALERRINRGGIREVILATSPTLEGDGTALYISNLLYGKEVKMTKLARGLPSGSSLELANAQMLADALEGRRAF